MKKHHQFLLVGPVILLLLVISAYFLRESSWWGQSRIFKNFPILADTWENAPSQWVIPATQGTWYNTHYNLVAGQRYQISDLSGELCFLNEDYNERPCLDGIARSAPSGWCNDIGDCSNGAYCKFGMFYPECGPPPEMGGFDRFINFSHAALLAKQGNGNDTDPDRVFKLSDGFPGENSTATYSGPLFLMINDHKATDNTGSFSLEISH